MRDANGNPGGTSLFPMRHNLHALMLHKQALFRTHGIHTYMDIDGIMYDEKAAEFRNRRDHILSHFVAHFQGFHSQEVVMSVVGKTE